VSVLETVKRLKDALVRNKAEQGSWSDYKSILKDILDGKEIDPQEAESICNELGKSLDDLAKDAELFQKRLGWQAEIEAAKATSPKLQSVLSEIEKVQREYNLARAKFQQRMNTLGPQRTELEHIVSRLAGADQDLRQSVQDPSILHRREETRREILEAVALERKLDEQINNGSELTSYKVLIGSALIKLDAAEKAYKATPKDEYAVKKHSEAKSVLDALQQNRARAIKSLEAVRKRISDIRQRQEENEKKAMTP
jgi:hypothetical protein